MVTTLVRIAALPLALLVATAANAQAPAHNVDPQRHPNMAAAQDLIGQAFDRLVTAQEKNNYDVGGHASRAKQLLVEASNEIKAAAVSANSH